MPDVINYKSVPISKIKLNKENPRTISKEKFEKLVKSIKEFPEMLKLRPIIVNKDMVILGGNYRYRAAKEAGFKEVPIIVAENLTQDQENEFIIKDNVGFGEWDWDIIANEWDVPTLQNWGLDVPGFELPAGENTEGKYTRTIEALTYTPSDKCPELKELINADKCNELISEIDKADIPSDIKAVLRGAATRHIIFDYSKIADYYAHADKKVQALMEKSALVIIDFDKAIEYGFTQLSKEVADQFKAEK